MTNIERYNLGTAAVATIATALLFCLFSYFSVPESFTFFEAINPITTLAGFVFVLTYLGVPLAISIIAALLLLFLIWFIFFIIMRKIVK